MSTKKPIVAIVGRPNVGKSSLFNRILGRRFAVVDEIAGVTRDRNYMETRWNGCSFLMTDTGGLMPGSDEPIAKEVRQQVELAVDESTVILFLVDAQTGPADVDQEVARLLRKRALDRVILVANKAESKSAVYDIAAFNKLGLNEPVPVSALHGTNVGNLLDVVVDMIKKKPFAVMHDEGIPALRLAIVGRPNAGKSSLVNKLLNEHRMIVDEVPGTTRDAIDTRLIFHGQPIVLIDTAGLRKKARVDKGGLEYYSNLRALESINRADVCGLVIDAQAGFGEQDLKILDQILSKRKGVLLIFNKWDLVVKGDKTFDHMLTALRRSYTELQHVPAVSISALTGQRVPVVIELALKIKAGLRVRIPAAAFRRELFRWVREKPHPITANVEVRILGGKQVPADYPIFHLFSTNAHQIKQSYSRYLSNKIHEQFGFDGCPVVLSFKTPTRPSHKRSLASA